MNLRELTPADAPRCAELEKVLFPGETPWTEAIFKQEMAQPFTFYLGVEGALDPAVPEDGEKPVLWGYAGIGMMGPVADPEFEIHTIGVDPKAQRRGIARMMMENICHIADVKSAPIFLEVRVGNDPAIELYRRYGFNIEGIRRNYYQPSGADAHVMMRPSQTPSHTPQLSQREAKEQ